MCVAGSLYVSLAVSVAVPVSVSVFVSVSVAVVVAVSHAAHRYLGLFCRLCLWATPKGGNSRCCAICCHTVGQVGSGASVEGANCTGKWKTGLHEAAFSHASKQSYWKFFHSCNCIFNCRPSFSSTLLSALLPPSSLHAALIVVILAPLGNGSRCSCHTPHRYGRQTLVMHIRVAV